METIPKFYEIVSSSTRSVADKNRTLQIVKHLLSVSELFAGLDKIISQRDKGTSTCVQTPSVVGRVKVWVTVELPFKITLILNPPELVLV